MRKNFIVKFMTAILLIAMSFTLVFVGDRAIEVEAAGDEITVDYTFVDADVSSAANQKGKVASFKFEGDFEVQLKNDTYDKPLRYFKTDTSGRYVVIREKNVFTIKNNGENTLVSFKFIRTKADAFKCSLTNANACSDSTVDKDLIFTPINPNEDIVISLIAEAYGVTGMVITYSEPTVATVSDGSHETLLAAIAKENIEEIVITKPIEFSGSDSKEYDVDAKNKILRAEITGLDAFGALQEGSTNVLFHIKAGDTVTIKNAVIYGGSRAAIINKGYLYMENVTVSRSGNYTSGTSPDSRFTDAYGGICNYNDSSTSLTAKLVMKNCNITRNVSKNGGGILNNKGTVIIDGCSITENRASNNGGAIQTRESSGNVVINNTLIANNTANNYGGGIYLNASRVYIINSTITGNATANTTMGGGITNWYAYLYAVNNIITDNYAFEDGTPLENDFFTTGTNSYEILLYNNIYGASNIQGITATLGNNHQLENKSSNVELFVGYQTSGNILGDGSTSTVAFEKPAIIKLSDGRYYAPVNINCEIVENGIKTYMAYTAEGKGSSFYLSYMKDCVNTKLGQAFDISENEVTTFISGEERTNSIIGSSNASNVKIRTVRGTNSNTDAGTISGITLYGESYEYGSLVTVTAIPNEGYELDYWMDENGTILSSQKEYTFEVLKNITITPVWVSTVNVGNVTISNLTCDAVVYGGSRSIKLNNLVLEVGSKIEGLYLNDTKVADENLFLLPNISGIIDENVFGITDENGQWIATEDVVLTAKIVPTLGVISTTGYSGTYDGSAHEITVEATSPEDIVYNWYFNGSLIEGANASTLNVTNVLESGKYYCLLTSIIDGEEVSVRTETIIVDIAAIKVAIPTINNDTYTYNGSEQSVELNGIESCMTVTGDKATNAGNYEVIISLDSNYEWQESFNGKYAWTIEKADCDLSHIKFEDLTVIYNGNKQVIEITGTLPEGVEAYYTNNEGIDVNTYDATVEFVSVNYNVEGIKLTATLTINKAKVELPEATSFIYDGTVKVAIAAHDLYTVEGATATVVGSYEATVTLNDTANYEWAEEFNGKVAWTITKATYDMSGIKFENVTVTYDGSEHVIEITGTLPEGVTVSYTNNKGTNAGTYNATAKFTYDTANYNTIVDMNAVLTINTDEHSYVNPETNVEDVIVSTEDGNGIDPNKEVKIEMVEAEVSSESFDEFLDKKERVAIAYDVKLIQDGVSVQPDGTLKIKILIPEELRDREFSIMHVHNGDEKYMLEYEIEGDYVVFYTDKLSSFVFVYETGSILWLLIVFAVIVILEAGLLVFLLNKKKQFKLVKLAAAYPPFVFGMFLPAVQLVFFIILLVAIVALTTMDAIFGYELYGDKIKTFFKKDNDSKAVEQEVEVESTLDQEEIDPEEVEEPVAEEVIETEPVVEESTEDDDEEDVMQVWDEETHSLTIIRIIKSFTARLIQSKDEVKAYYDIIENELLSYKKVKSRISFKHEVFKFGKDNVVRLRFRGKTLCLYLALNPADYENTKYKIEDMSAISNSSDVPTMYRINLLRRADYAKELIYDLMKNLGAERMDIDYKEYSKEYPYEDNEALLEKGLIKKSVKVIGNGTSTKTLVNPVNIVKKVSASEVNNLITDEQVIELIEQSTRIADKTKKTIINIDTLSQYFNENETVTLEEIKKRIPNVEKKATYYKVLARGILDKPLTVDADDFSIEAEKMIIVTGGKVLVSKAK